MVTQEEYLDVLAMRRQGKSYVEIGDPDRRTLRVRMADTVRTLPARYLDDGHVAHAYATTIHKAQGMTVDHTFVLGTDDFYREVGYVALSRGRTANTLYTVGAHEPETDLTHAPQRDHPQPADLEAIEGRPLPEPSDDLDLGLGLDL